MKQHVSSVVLASTICVLIAFVSGCAQNAGDEINTNGKSASNEDAASGYGSSGYVNNPSSNSLTKKSIPAKPTKKAVAAKARKLTKIVWQTGWDAAFASARKQQKPVLIDFYADWCGACKYLDANIYTAPVVVQESQYFVSLKINSDKATEIASKYQVQSLPTILFLDPQEKVLLRQEGAPQAPELFVQWMQEARKKAAGTPA